MLRRPFAIPNLDELDPELTRRVPAMHDLRDVFLNGPVQRFFVLGFAVGKYEKVEWHQGAVIAQGAHVAVEDIVDSLASWGAASGATQVVEGSFDVRGCVQSWVEG